MRRAYRKRQEETLVMGDGGGQRRIPDTDMVIVRVGATDGPISFALLAVRDVSTEETTDDALLPEEGAILRAERMDAYPPAMFKVVSFPRVAPV